MAVEVKQAIRYQSMKSLCMQKFAGCFLLISGGEHPIAEPSINHTYTRMSLHTTAFWYDGQCTVTAEKARHVAADKVSTALTWLHNIGSCTSGILWSGHCQCCWAANGPICSITPLLISYRSVQRPAVLALFFTIDCILQCSTACFELSLCTSKSAEREAERQEFTSSANQLGCTDVRNISVHAATVSTSARKLCPLLLLCKQYVYKPIM